jgi:hypothetical protein
MGFRGLGKSDDCRHAIMDVVVWAADAAASGSYSFSAITEVNWADGTVTGVSLWK